MDAAALPARPAQPARPLRTKLSLYPDLHDSPERRHSTESNRTLCDKFQRHAGSPRAGWPGARISARAGELDPSIRIQSKASANECTESLHAKVSATADAVLRWFRILLSLVAYKSESIRG